MFFCARMLREGSLMEPNDLEALYERLAEAIDRAGPAKESLFLTKLCLLLFNAGSDRRAAESAIQSALQDL